MISLSILVSKKDSSDGILKWKKIGLIRREIFQEPN